MSQFYEGLVNIVDLKSFFTQIIAFFTARDKTYYNDMVQYMAPDQIMSNCAEISFYNIGTTTLYVNGVPFAPQAGISFDGKKNEMDTTKYKINFSGAGDNICFVIRKVYN